MDSSFREIEIVIQVVRAWSSGQAGSPWFSSAYSRGARLETLNSLVLTFILEGMRL
jgi:hypothetical protein